jgi:hypothetical protein
MGVTNLVLAFRRQPNACCPCDDCMDRLDALAEIVRLKAIIDEEANRACRTCTHQWEATSWCGPRCGKFNTGQDCEDYFECDDLGNRCGKWEPKA